MPTSRRVALIGTFLLSLTLSYTHAQGPWKGKNAAVVLTYDDALNVHLDNVIPGLDSLGIKGTFYLSGYFPGCRERVNDWRGAAHRGHELGNHTLFHPCIGNMRGREWVSAERDMSRYSRQRLLEEIRMTNVFLHAIDGKTVRTFAYPCGDTSVGDSSYIEDIKKDFVGARGVKNGFVSPTEKELYNIDAVAVNGQSGADLIRIVDEAIKSKKLVVFLFHGVGGEHALNVGLKEHRDLIHYLKRQEKDIWVAPFIDVVQFIKAK